MARVAGPRGVAGILLPGGFAYGDYLRAGVIARFSPVMRAVAEFADRGGPVLGICNGFQVLAEAGLVPGALLRNRALRFVCREVTLLPEHLDTPFTRELDGRPLRMPVAHGEGCYYGDDAALDALERDGRVLWRYANPDGSVAGPDDPGNPNGSLRGIAGVRQRGRQRGRPDAPPGDGVGGAPRVGRRPRASSARSW